MRSGVIGVLLAAAGLLLAGVSPAQAQPVDVSFQGARIDLLPRVEAVESFAPQATIELPGAEAGRETVPLNARGPGPLYRWAVFTLHNPESVQREMIIAAPHQHFAGSGLVWPRPEGSRIVALTTAEGAGVAPLRALGTDAFAIALPPDTSVTYVAEVSAAGLDSLMLWRPGAFHAVAGQYAFFRGMVLGISVLMGIAIISLLIIRPQAAFAAVALFGWSAIAFLAIEAGYLPTVAAGLGELAGSGPRIRAVIEALMLTGVAASLVTLLELRRRMPYLGLLALGLTAAAAALAVAAWFEPRVAAGVARIGFAAVVVAGLGVIVVLRRRGVARARAALLAWLVLTAWTVLAGLGALDVAGTALMQPLISAGLMLVLVTVGFTLAQFAFSPRLSSGRIFEEAARRALALAASDQGVWDWQADRGRLHVGPEIVRLLGLDDDSIDAGDLSAWLERIHPADRAAFSATIAGAERRGRGGFAHQFRMRRADGSYRWLLLRAKAVPGAQAGAVRLIGTLADVNSLRHSEDRLLADAVRDRVTGLPNRGLFLDRVERALHRAGWAEAADLHVLAVDLDRFKSLNEALGHEAGDVLLKTVGHRLAACVGPDDTVARLSGGQFAILCHGANPPRDMIDFAARLAGELSRPVSVRGSEVVVSASVGIAPYHIERRAAEPFLKDAEVALYEAKRRGHGAVEVFRPDMLDERCELLSLEQSLRRALERNEIEVVYQPIVRLADRKLAGFEALMRWRRGADVLEPDSFIGLAEDTGLIRELGRHVLSEAGRRLGMWQRAFRPHEPLHVAVNVSSSQLLNGDLVAEVEALMEREELKPGTLKLELTESVVMDNPELAHQVLQRLKHMGVTLACDDFGTGYSAFESLLRLPFDTVKIAGSLLEAPAEGDERSWTVVKSIVRLARDLDLAVVAEGIETEDQMQRLEQLGCAYGQGYFIGMPMTPQQVVVALGGLAYAAPHTGGLAALLRRVSGRGGESLPAPPVPETPRHNDAAPATAMAAEPEPVLDMRAVLADDGRREGDKAPASETGEPVIDLRGIMPGAAAPARPFPAVGSVPFAPRPARTAETTELQPEAAEPDATQPAASQPTDDAEPVEPAEAIEAQPQAAEPDATQPAASAPCDEAGPVEPDFVPADTAKVWPVIELSAASLSAFGSPHARDEADSPDGEPVSVDAGHVTAAKAGERHTKGPQSAAAKSLRKRVRRSRRSAAKRP